MIMHRGFFGAKAGLFRRLSWLEKMNHHDGFVDSRQLATALGHYHP